MALKDLDKGDKVDIHLSLYPGEIAIIDKLRAKYNCSRAAVVGAMIKEQANIDLSGVKEGRRPGGGRKKGPRKDPMEEFYAIVPELKRKI